MSRTSTLITLGVLIILTPFSGLPIAIRTSLLVIFGAAVASIGLSMRMREAQSARPTTEPPVQQAAPAPETPKEPASPTGVSPI